MTVTATTTHAAFVVGDDGKYRASVVEHPVEGAEVKLYRVRPCRSSGGASVSRYVFVGKWVMHCTVHEALDHISTIINHLGGDDNTVTE
jgi:hypothetical protein